MTIEKLKRVLHHPNPPQLWYQLTEIVESRIYLQHGVEVHQGDTVLDAGANVGVAAAFFADECGAGRVHSFEPVPPIFEVLDENVRAFPACVTHEYGLAASSGREVIGYYPNDWAISGLHANPAAERATSKQILLNLGWSVSDAEARLEGRFVVQETECDFSTVSDVLVAESIEQVDLLKVDVEGAELEVLTGVREADWPRIHQVVAELHTESNREAATGMLEARGFTVTVAQDPAMAGTPITMLYGTRP